MGFVAEEYRAAPLSDEKARKCCLKVSCCTLGRRKCSEVSPKRAVLYSRATESMGFVAEESPSSLRHSAYTHGQQKCTEVSPESVVLHPRATKMRGSVTQAYRILLLGDEKCGFRCRGVPFILTSFCPTPTGNKNGRKCHPGVPCRTLGRQKGAEVSPESVVLHPRATKMRDSVAQAYRILLLGDEKYMGFVAEESPLFLRHSALHPRATKKDGSVA